MLYIVIREAKLSTYRGGHSYVSKQKNLTFVWSCDIICRLVLIYGGEVLQMLRKKKAVALDWVINFITSIILFISYSMTVDMLHTATSGAADVPEFIRGAAVFLIPCAIEGINIIINKTGKKAYVDTIEVVISVASLIAGGYLVYATFANKYDVPVYLIKPVLLIYPFKYLINFFDGFIELLRLR